MVSEGVDIPRLRVGVYANTIKTPLFFRQVIGRFVRTTPASRPSRRSCSCPPTRRSRHSPRRSRGDPPPADRHRGRRTCSIDLGPEPERGALRVRAARRAASAVGDRDERTALPRPRPGCGDRHACRSSCNHAGGAARPARHGHRSCRDRADETEYERRARLRRSASGWSGSCTIRPDASTARSSRRPTRSSPRARRG